VLLLCIMQLLEVAWYTLWDRTCSILYSKDHDTFYRWPIRDLGLMSGGYNITNKYNHIQIESLIKVSLLLIISVTISSSSLKVAISILKKFMRPLRSSDDNSCTKAWYAPYWFLLAIQDLTHNLPKRFPLYCWIPAAIIKIQTGMIMSSLSGFSILVEQFPMKHATWFSA